MTDKKHENPLVNVRLQKAQLCMQIRKLALDVKDEDGIQWEGVPIVNPNHTKYSRKLNRNVKQKKEESNDSKGKWNKNHKPRATSYEEDLLEYQSPQAMDMMFTLVLTAYNTWQHLSVNNILTNMYLVARIYAPDILQTGIESLAAGLLKQYEHFVDLLSKHFLTKILSDKSGKKLLKKNFMSWVEKGEQLIHLPSHPDVDSMYAQDHYARYCIENRYNGQRHFGDAILNTLGVTELPLYLIMNMFVYFATDRRFGEKELIINGMFVRTFTAKAAFDAKTNGTIVLVNGLGREAEFTVPLQLIRLYDDLSSIDFVTGNTSTDVDSSDSEEEKFIKSMEQDSQYRQVEFALASAGVLNEPITCLDDVDSDDDELNMEHQSPAVKTAFDTFMKSYLGNDNNLYQSGPLGAAASSLISSLSVAPILIATGKVKNYDEYLKWYNENLKIWDISAGIAVNLMNFVQTFLTTGLPYMLTGDATYLYPTQTWEKFIQLATSILSTIGDNMRMATILTTTSENDVISAIDSVILFGRNTWISSKESVPHPMALSMTRLLQQLDESRMTVHRMYRNKRNNPIPLCVKLYGYTGIGKSQICKYLCSMMCINCGTKAANNVYYQNPMDKYQSGYTAHEILVMDDVGAENVDNIKNESLMNFLSLSTEVPVMTNQASVDDKGTIPYNLKGIVMTTNFEDAKCRNYFNLAEVFLRRFLHIHVKVKPEFAINVKKTPLNGIMKNMKSSDEAQLDPEKAKGRLDVHTFDVTVYVNGNYEFLKFNEKETKNMEFQDFVEFFREYHLEHLKKAKQSLQRTNLIENSEWCVEHKTYSFVCKCETKTIVDNEEVYEFLPFEDNVKRGVKPLDIRAFEGMEGAGLFRALINFSQTEQIILKPGISDNISEFVNRMKSRMTKPTFKLPDDLVHQGWLKRKLLGCFTKNITARDISDVVTSTFHNTLDDFRRRRLDATPVVAFKETIEDFISSHTVKIFLGLGAIGASIMTLLALYKSTKYLLSSAMNFQGMYVKKYATEQEKSQFNDIDVQFEFPGARMPYPPKERVAAQQSITPGQFRLNANLSNKIEALLRHNMLLLTIETVETVHRAWGLALCKNLVLVNSHDFSHGGTYKIIAHGDCGSYNEVIRHEDVWRNPDNDTSIIMFSAAPFRSIPLGYQNKDTVKFSGKAKAFRINSGEFAKYKNPDFGAHLLHLNVLATQTIQEYLGKHYIYYDCERTQVGHCGNPVFVPELGLLGVHSVASKTTGKSYYTPITQQDIVDATEFFRKKNLVVMNNAPEILHYQNYVVESNKNSIMLNTCGNHHVIGSIVGHRERPKSKIRRSLVADFLPDPGKKIPHMDPIINENGEWIHPVQVKLQTIAKAPIHINEHVLEKALEFFKEHLESLIDWKSVRPTGLKEVVQGVPGTTSEPMNLSTSSGPGLPGKTKRDHIRYINKNNDDRIFDKLSMGQFLNMLMAWKRGEMALLPSKWFPKDEPIKPSKEDEGRQRYVSCSPMAKLIASKICFRDIFLRIRASGKSHMCVGMNAASISWSSIPEKLKTLDPELKRLMDSDYVFYDAYCYLLSRVLAVFIELLKDNEYYNIEIDFGEGVKMTTLEMLKCLAAEMIFYPVEVCGEFILLITALESGADSTAEFNSLMETLIHFLIWTQSWLDHSSKQKFSEPQDSFAEWILALDITPNPNQHLVLFNYGDDNLDTCSEAVSHWYTPSARQTAAAALGFPITDARKRKELKYVRLDEIVFLKRSFIWNEEAQAYFAPLDESAINQIMYFVKGNSDTIETLTYNNVRDAHRQYFMYGRERFDEETIRLKALLESAKLTNLCDDSWPTFDELLSDFKAKTLHMGGL